MDPGHGDIDFLGIDLRRFVGGGISPHQLACTRAAGL
jgi:hypothetical protein